MRGSIFSIRSNFCNSILGSCFHSIDHPPFFLTSELANVEHNPHNLSSGKSNPFPDNEHKFFTDTLIKIFRFMLACRQSYAAADLNLSLFDSLLSD
jgi:hypothetical protein